MVDIVLVVLVTAWLMGHFVCAYVAGEKGRSSVGWWFISLFASPLLALIALAAIPVRHEEQADEPGEDADAPDDPRDPRLPRRR